MAVIEVRGLRKAYGGRTVVDGVDFAVEEGEIFGILGPNGAGKTTTVECVEGLRVPDSGTVRVAGLDPVADHDRVTLLSVLVAGAQTMPGVLTGYRERGILRRLSTTPASPRSLLVAQIVLHGAAILLSVLLAVTIGRLAFGVALPEQPAGYVLAIVLTVLAGLALGAAVSALSRTTKIAQTVGTIAFLPELLRDIVGLTPFGAASQALDQAAAGDWPSWSHLGVTGLWAALLIGAAVRWFRWE